MSTPDPIMSLDLSTRSKRRKATALAINLLEHIRIAEEASIDKFPCNLQNGDAFTNAEESLDIIIDAIAALGDAY